MKSRNARWLSGMACVILAASVSAATTETQRPFVRLRVVDNQLQFGADTTRPFYLQWRTPEGAWQNWGGGGNQLEGLSGFWLRGVFESGDPMLWDAPSDAGGVYTPGALSQKVDGEIWVPIAALDEEGSYNAAPPIDVMASLMDSPPYPVDDAPRNNQASATPQPWAGNFYWTRSTDGRTVIWRVQDDGDQIPLLTPFEGPATGYTLRYITDLNGDGNNDLIWTRDSDNRTLGWLLSMDGYITEYKTLFTGGAAGYTLRAAADLNDDGTMDLIWTRNTDNRTVGWIFNAEGEIEEYRTIYAGGAPGYTFRAMTDLNDDGILDMVWTRDSDNRTVGWLMDSEGAISSYSTIYAGGAPGYTFRSMVDLNGDSILDMVWTRNTDNRTVGWLLDSEGAISSYKTIYAGGAPGYTLNTMFDVNQDSIPDMVWTRDSDGRTLAWLLDAEGDIAQTIVISAGGNSGWRLVGVAAPY